MKAHLRAGDHEGVAHVVPRVAEVSELQALETAFLFFDREKVCQHLRGVELIRQTVPNRNAGVFGQFFDEFLAETAVLNAVKHPAEDLGRVGDGLLLSHLAAAGV